MSTPSENIIVIGAGIIGLNCAYYLERAGYTVTVLDQHKVGMACSHANCGYICPSHVLPLTEPGAIKTAMKSMFNPNAPFRVKPRFSPALWRWLIEFARRCNHRDMLAAGHPMRAILDASMVAYREMVAAEAIDCEWQDCGLLYAFQGESGLEEFAANDRLLQEHFGVAARRMNAQELHAFDPALRADLAGGFLYEDDAVVRPDKLNDALHDLLTRRGVTFIEQCALTGVRKKSGRVVAVKTSKGELEADQFVLATGAWSAQWSAAFECKLPVQPGKGYSVTLPRPENSPRSAILFPETRVGITSMQDYLRFGSMMEFSGYDHTIRPERLKLLYEGANMFLVEPVTTPAEAQWYGWRPMTWDSLPIIGPAPRLPNVMLATGHNMLGLSLGAATGKLVAELIAGESPHFDPAPFSVTRF